MKRISMRLQFALMLLLGTVGAFSDALCSLAATNTIKNGVCDGIIYSFEVWSKSTGDPLPVNQALFLFNYNKPAFKDVQWNFTNLAPSQRYSDYTVSLGFGTYANGVNYIQVYMELKSGKSPIILSSDNPDGECMFTIRIQVNDVSALSGISWRSNSSGFYYVANQFVGGDNSPLPIQLSSFKATTLTGNGVRMTWTTVSETNNYGFNVQRNGANTAFIQGHGTTIEQHTYSYTDSPGPGKYQYRLQQVDLNGMATLSESILIDVAGKFALEQNYPNPFNPSTQISFSSTKEGPVSLRVYDILGREVATLANENRKPGEYTERFDGGRVASGVYMYVLRSSEGQLVGRMMLSK